MGTKGFSSSGNDAIVWNSFKQGCEDAFAGIYQKHVAMLFSYGMHIARDQDLVKDCIQSLFADLWDRRKTLDDVHSIKYYLFKCLKRRIVAELLASKKFNSLEELTEDYDFEIVFSHESSLVADQASKEEHESLLQAINKLTKRQKEVIYHLYYHNLSPSEVASLMSIKVPAVYNLVYQALISLRKAVTRVYTLLFVFTSLPG